MKGTLIRIDTSGVQTRTEVIGKVSYELLKRSLGGAVIESVPFFNDIFIDDDLHLCTAFCDEEGKIKRLELNRSATSLWQRSLVRQGRSLVEPDNSITDYLVGPVLVLFGDKEFMSSI